MTRAQLIQINSALRNALAEWFGLREPQWEPQDAMSVEELSDESVRLAEFLLRVNAGDAEDQDDEADGCEDCG